MDEGLDGARLDGWTNEWIDLWMNGWTASWMDGLFCVSLDE